MLMGLTVLLCAQLAGEFLSRWLGLPVPGPVVGMGLLFALLAAYGGVPAGVRQAAEGLLAYLALLFVPAGVGLMVHTARMQADAVAIAAALVVSTALALAVTAGLFHWLRPRDASHPPEDR